MTSRGSSKFADALQNQDRSDLTILMADMVGTKEKARQGIDLVGAFTRFIGVCEDKIEQFGGAVLRLQDDAIKAAFPTEHKGNAVRAAVAIQQELDGLGPEDEHARNCAIGVATGPVIRVPNDDHVGDATVLARHLALAGSAKSVLLDSETVDGLDHSALDLERYGGSAQSLRTPHRIRLPVLGDPVVYYEAQWSQSPFGVKSHIVTVS